MCEIQNSGGKSLCAHEVKVLVLDDVPREAAPELLLEAEEGSVEGAEDLGALHVVLGFVLEVEIHVL